MYKVAVAIFIVLLLVSTAYAQVFGGYPHKPWHRGGSGGGGGILPPPLIHYSVTGPASGATGVASTNFTVSVLGGAHFNGSDTITITDGGGGGTITPSVGAPGVSTVTVMPASLATGFTFTYTPAIDATHILTFTNAQGFANPGVLAYTSPAGGGCSNSLDFSQACNSQYIGAIL